MTIDTKKNEIRYSTRDTFMMKGKFIADTLLRKWNEQFHDEDTAEVVTVERHELIADRGRLIDANLIQEIDFFLQSGDIEEVVVSNQRREGFVLENKYLSPWLVTAKIGDKNKKFLLYASTVTMAIDVVTDYIELNYSQGFYILNVKEFTSNIILKDSLKKYNIDQDPDQDIEIEDEEKEDKKFYQIEIKVISDEYSGIQTFVIETTDVDRAMMIIKDYISKKIKDREKEEGHTIEFKVMIETAKIIPCNHYIEKDFSLAYTTDDK